MNKKAPSLSLREKALTFYQCECLPAGRQGSWLQFIKLIKCVSPELPELYFLLDSYLIIWYIIIGDGKQLLVN